MKIIWTVFYALIFLSTGFAQTIGVIECNGKNGVSAWEKPESIIVVEHLSCGRSLPVVGVEKGFVKVRLNESLIAYVNVDNIRVIENASVSAESGPDIPMRKEPFPEKKTSPLPSPTLSPPVRETAKLPLNLSNRDTVLRRGLEFGLDSSYIRYEEPDFMKEEGITLSLYGDYTLRPKDFMFRLEGRIGFGGMSYSSPVSGETKRVRDYIGEARGVAGYTFRASDKWYLTPYAGFGYRYLFDGMGGKVTTEGHLGYDRRSNYLYTPIGLETSSFLKPGWALVTKAEYDLFWKGWQESELGDIIGTGSAIVNDQNDGWGLRASGKFIKEMGRRALVFGPYLKYWDIEDSEWVNVIIDDEEAAFLEPANTSLEIGGMFGVVF